MPFNLLHRLGIGRWGRKSRKNKMERCEPVVQEVLEPCEGLATRAMRLLHHVEGEFEDEDGDTANGFILADPVPSSFIDASSFVDLDSSSFQSSKLESSLDGEYDTHIPQHIGRKHKLEECDDGNEIFYDAAGPSDRACFICLSCNQEVELEDLALLGLTCPCLFCKTCFGSYARSIVKSLNTDSSIPSAKVAIRAKNSADAAKYSRTNSSKFVDLTGGLTGVFTSSLGRDYVPCPSAHCTGRFPLAELQLHVPESFSAWEEAASKALLQNNDVFVKCPGCNVMIEKIKCDLPPGLAPSGVPEFDRTVPFIELDNEGKTLSRIAMVHKAENRFRCSACNGNFCATCLVSPYHLGKTCQEYDEELKADKCIYCNKPIIKVAGKGKVVDVNISIRKLRAELERGGVDSTWCMEKSELMAVRQLCGRVCPDKGCRQRLGTSCTRVLHCGHHCGGVRGELRCLPCLEDDCKEAASLPSSDELCGICLVEELRLAPSIQMECGHVVHLHCAKAQIDGGCPGPQITFGYLCCPQCKKLMQHPSLNSSMREPLKMMDQIKVKAVKRMEMEGIFTKTKLKGDAVLAAEIEKYQFYSCSKCWNPYFGGKRNCQVQNIEQRSYNPAELVCGSCVAGEQGKCKRGHGTEYVEFKCQYCCNPATYFCWGKTHFCTACHNNTNQRSVIPCKGPKLCPFAGKHAPNGEECCVGCSMCRCQEQ